MNSRAFTVLAGLDQERAPRPASRRRTARPVTEAAVKDAVLRQIALRGGYAIAKHMTGAGTRGTPDVLACIEGRFVAIEVKRPGNIPEPAQLGQLRKWQAAGALACWVQGVEQLNEVLEHLHDGNWHNDFTHPGDGRHASDPW
ncbi:MAG TPA: hypothetical protein VGO18_34560 [Steroidobacteraceae bacterium]|nr:hypothetical protein [Steroidobacteraceae bacterium]